MPPGSNGSKVSACDPANEGRRARSSEQTQRWKRMCRMVRNLLTRRAAARPGVRLVFSDWRRQDFSVVAFFSKGFSLTDDDYVRVGALADLKEGRMRSCKVADREIVLCRVDGQVYALDNVCTHALARMSEGRLRGKRLICPLHGASFDVRTGQVLAGPAVQPLPRHHARTTPEGAVEVALDPNAPPQPRD